MGSVEKIRELQRQQAQRETEQKLHEFELQKEAYRRERETEEANRLAAVAAENRLRFERSDRERILKESGVLSNLQKLTVNYWA